MIRGFVVCVILLTAGLAGCIAVGGTSNSQRPTTGQELVDLKLALDKGAITQAEYDQKKAELMARR